MSGIIEHPGTVLFIQNGTARIKITQYSACSGCHARSACSLSDSCEKEIDIPYTGTGLQAGDSVIITGTEQIGNRAVRMAFIYPFIVLFITLLAVFYYTEDEFISGIVALASLIPYYAILYFFKSKLKKRLVFSLKQPELT